MKLPDLPFVEIWALDFEFAALPGERAEVRCLVARELRSGRELHYWADELEQLGSAPFADGSLLVAYYASAEMGCFLVLGWPVKCDVLDLFVEFRQQTNGIDLAVGNSLLGSLVYFGLPAMDVEDKSAMRQLALRGGVYTIEEKQALMSYCADDVHAIESLLPHILKRMSTDDLQRALLRGRYMSAAAKIEFTGVPIDMALRARLNANWDWMKDELVVELDADYGVYEDGIFKTSRWEQWLEKNQIEWPRSETQRLKLDDETFRDVGRIHPEVETMRQLRHAHSQLRLNDLAVGADGRNRQILSAFSSKTGRNQPSTSAFIFGPAVWMRSLIRPNPGWAIAYTDWEQQEWGIAAYLSGDHNMIAAYKSSDPYLKFAQLAGAVPAGATRTTHPLERERFKQCALSVQYGQGAKGLAPKAGIREIEAEILLKLHRDTFRRYWAWSDGVEDYALLNGRLHTAFGWQINLPHTTSDEVRPNGRSLRNFPMQANCAEMLRLACILATEDELEICAPVHDALLLHAPVERIDEHVARAQAHMAKASSLLLGGPSLRSDAKVFRYPDRYVDSRGATMWNTVQRLLARAQRPVH